MRLLRLVSAGILGLALAATAASHAAHDGKPGPGRQAIPEVQRERPKDPYVPVSPSEQILSPAAIVVRGQHHSIQINVDAAGNNIIGDAANEPTLAIDPTDPRNIVAGWRQFYTVSSDFRQAGYAYSHDGGATWTFAGVLQAGHFRSDPVLAADSAGTFFYSSLGSETSADIFISADKGETWQGPIPSFGGDKQWLAVDATGGTGDGNLYVAWNSQFTCCAAGTDFTRSIDGGLTYQGPEALPSKAKWGAVAVGPDGEVYVIGTRIDSTAFPVPHLIQKSANAGDPGQVPVFSPAVGIDLGGLSVLGGGPNPGGLLGQVWVAVDSSSGPARGNVYALASVDPPGEDPLDVHFARSTDGGATWSAPMRINDDPGTGAWQWFGTLSVAPTGRIDAVWNDTRNDPTALTSELFYSYSTDAGATWSASLPVSPAWNAYVGYPNQNKIGDYYHMISDGDAGNLVYAATFNGGQDIYFLRVGDCNASGRHDSVDIALHTSLDCNANGIPDECEETAPPCSVCSTGSQCDDGVFCNGAESCDPESMRCQAGPAPACDDGDPCTADRCDATDDVCTHGPIDPAGPVGDTLRAAPGGAPPILTLSWSAVPGAVHYNTYRGSIPVGGMGSRPAGAYDHTCFESADGAGDGSTVTTDSGILLPGTAAYYLVSAENTCAEGPLGASSGGAPRPLPLPCPTPP
jgi:hypothetical protein